jgi:integration host factor subunit alpha
MNRQQMVHVVAAETGLTRDTVDTVIVTFFELLITNIALGETVTIRGVGYFKPRRRPPVVLRNPHNGSAIPVEDRVTMTFRPSQVVKKRLNRGDGRHP